jgi:hypothetical protein
VSETELKSPWLPDEKEVRGRKRRSALWNVFLYGLLMLCTIDRAVRDGDVPFWGWNGDFIRLVALLGLGTVVGLAVRDFIVAGRSNNG